MAVLQFADTSVEERAAAMRVTGGVARGVPLRPPHVAGVRPTTDLVRTALFNILASRGVEGLAVVDLFAGTGSLGIEALSRGAARADFVESNHHQVADIRANTLAAKVADRATVRQAYVTDALNRLDGPYDLVLMDPPYRDPFPMDVVERFGSDALLAESGQVVVGHPSRAEPPLRCGLMALADDRRYGDSALAFYERITEELAL